jgi:hypothetical protein
VAILIKELWNFPQRRKWARDQKREDLQLQKIYAGIRSTGMTETGAPVVSLPNAEIMLRMIQRCLPLEGYRLLKIQAEKGLCETMIPGLLLLAALDVWLLVAADTWLPERIWLLPLLGFSIATLWQWRKGLEDVYRRSLCVLWHLLQTSSAAPHHTDRIGG